VRLVAEPSQPIKSAKERGHRWLSAWATTASPQHANGHRALDEERPPQDHIPRLVVLAAATFMGFWRLVGPGNPHRPRSQGNQRSANVMPGDHRSAWLSGQGIRPDLGAEHANSNAQRHNFPESGFTATFHTGYAGVWPAGASSRAQAESAMPSKGPTGWRPSSDPAADGHRRPYGAPSRDRGE
jgi:hypothetical protein